MQRVYTRSDLSTLAQRVRDVNRGAARRLSELHDAVTNGTNSEAWALTDPTRVIDIESITEDMRRTERAGGIFPALEWIRNWLVLMPIFVTWLGLATAVGAYQTMLDDKSFVAQNPDAPKQSFLYLWQQGFYGHSAWSWLNFSHIALMDALMIGTVIVLTMMVYGRREAGSRAFRMQLSDAVADAALFLNGQRWGRSPDLVDRFDIASNRLLDEIKAERARISQLAANAQSQVSQLGKFAEKLEQGVNGLLNVSQNLANAQASFQADMARVATPLNQLADQQKAVMQEARQAAVEIKSFLSAQNTGVTGLQAAADRLVRAAIDAVNKGSQFDTAVGSFTKSQQELLATLAAHQKAQAEVVTRLSDTVTELQMALKQVGRFVPNLTAIAVDMNEAAGNQREVVENLRRLRRVMEPTP